MIERHGKPVAALVPIEDLETIRALEDRIDLEAARAVLKKRGARPWAHPSAPPYCAVQPPSITSSLPVTNEASSDARYRTP